MANATTTKKMEYPLKLTLGEEIRRVRLAAGVNGIISYEMFFNTTMTAFPRVIGKGPVFFEWTDDEGGMWKISFPLPYIIYFISSRCRYGDTTSNIKSVAFSILTITITPSLPP